MERSYRTILEANIKKYLDIFFKNYKYAINIDLKRHHKFVDNKIDELMLYPCERILLNPNVKEYTSKISELEKECKKEDLKNLLNENEIEKFILGKEFCTKRNCFMKKVIYNEEKEPKRIFAYQKTNGNEISYYEISFMEKTNFSEEMIIFYKYFISKTLDMFKFNHNLEVESNIFINSIEEYKSFITKTFLSQILEETFNLKNSYEIIENIIQAFKLNYEKTQTNGTIIISDAIPSKDDYLIKFKNSLEIKEYKKIRKLLEISREKNKKLYLYFNKDGCKGVLKNNNLKNNIEIIIKNNQNYDFIINKDKIKNCYSVKNGNIFFDIPEVPEKFIKCKNLLDVAKSQSKGAIIVILPTNEVVKEIKPLSKSGIEHDKFLLDKEYMLNISSIDGATIIDTEGYCHGIGIILNTRENFLDKSEIKLDSSRGARYNSACIYHNYLKGKKISHYILIVSEDGDTDYFSYVDEITESFEKIKEKIADLYNDKKYKDVIKLYLANCEIFQKINKIYENLYDDLGETYNLIGLSYSNENEQDEAIKIYKLAIKINWLNPSIYNNLAVSYELKKEYKEEFNCYIKCIEIKENSLDKIILNNIVLFIVSNHISKNEIEELLNFLKENINETDKKIFNNKLNEVKSSYQI